MRITVSLRAEDLLALKKNGGNRLEGGEQQFAVKLGEPYLYATADELDAVATHFAQLALELRKDDA